jgi:hypothetical protein
MATGASTDRGGLALETASLTGLHWLGVVLCVATGVLHLGLGASFLPGGLGIAFIVAGAGYLVGVFGVLVDYRRPLLYLLGIPFTLGQIGAWYALNAPDFSALGIGDKIVQALLVVVLVTLYRRG